MSTILLILIQYIFLLVDNFNGFISIPFGISALPLNSTNLLGFFFFFTSHEFGTLITEIAGQI